VDWIHLAQDRAQWRSSLNTILNRGVPWKSRHFLTRWAIISFSRNILFHGVKLHCIWIYPHSMARKSTIFWDVTPCSPQERATSIIGHSCPFCPPSSIFRLSHIRPFSGPELVTVLLSPFGFLWAPLLDGTKFPCKVPSACFLLGLFFGLMEAVRSSETSVNIYWSARRHIPGYVCVSGAYCHWSLPFRARVLYCCLLGRINRWLSCNRIEWFSGYSAVMQVSIFWVATKLSYKH
jgi:hypothetical protein